MRVSPLGHVSLSEEIEHDSTQSRTFGHDTILLMWFSDCIVSEFCFVKELFREWFASEKN